METRRVRSETGATFEVDSSMLDDVPRDVGYRESGGVPLVSAIVPAPPVPPVRWAPVVIAIVVIGLAATLIASLR